MASNGPETVRGKFRKLGPENDGRKNSPMSELIFGGSHGTNKKRKR